MQLDHPGGQTAVLGGRGRRVTVFAAISLVVLLALGVLAPKWLVSLATLAWLTQVMPARLQ